MKTSRKSSSVSRVVRSAIACLIAALVSENPSFGEVRLLEGVYDPEIAARGFTGPAACTDLACFDWNPAFLVSDDENVRPFASMSTRFNESMIDTIDGWEQTQVVFSTDRYREKLLKTWNFVSRQTAKLELDLGLRVGSFGFSYSPANFGAALFVHDPVLPFGELYTYAFSSLRIGYSRRLPVTIPRVRSLTIGTAIKYTSATANRFVFNQISSQYDQIATVNGQWVRARLGAAAILDTPREMTLSAVLSGIPAYGSPLENMPDTDTLDLQPGASIELGRLWWGSLRGYYSLSRLTRDENFWLKQHAGLEGTIGKFKTSIGVSDAMLTYGLTLGLPIVKFSMATYGVEYSNLAHNVTDRVYWFKIEI
ncbi:MAG: hypothetical protein NDJ89_08360 [Oligoflexia bacterium]|nr:hypothetical protein [Oligoflexia bacterium]